MDKKAKPTLSLPNWRPTEMRQIGLGSLNGPGALPQPAPQAKVKENAISAVNSEASPVTTIDGDVSARPTDAPASSSEPWGWLSSQTHRRKPSAESPADIAAYVVRIFEGGKELGRISDGPLKIFERDHWRAVGDGELEEWALKALVEFDGDAKLATPRVLRDVVSMLRVLARPLPEQRTASAAGGGVLNLANGELWFDQVGSAQLKAHSADSGHTYVLPYGYDVAAQCPQFDATLDAIAKASDQPDEFKRLLLAQLGYILQPTRNIASVFIWLGPGANGKTLIAKVLASMLPPGSVLHYSISDLAGSRRALVPLMGKRLLIDDDVGIGTILPDGLLKKISEAKPMTTSLGRQGEIEFVNTAVPLLLANAMPRLYDLSHGMRRRLVVVPFTRVFEGPEIDPTLADRIIATERSGILVKALAAWKEVARTGNFGAPDFVKQATDRLIETASPLAGFIAECCDRIEEESVFRPDFASALSRWATACGREDEVRNRSWTKELEQLGFKVTKVRGNYVVRGLKLKAETYD